MVRKHLIGQGHGQGQGQGHENSIDSRRILRYVFGRHRKFKLFQQLFYFV